MTTTLVLLAHADPSLQPIYQLAAGPNVIVRPFVATPKEFGEGLSMPYTRMGQMFKRDGRILPQLVSRYAKDIAHDKIILAWWSGGYALAREVLKVDADRDALDACVALDGGHASERPDGSPEPALIEPFADFARLAKDGRKVFLYGHSTIDPLRYASTTEVGEAIAKAVGGEGGNFDVREYGKILGETGQAEHIRALREWGPVLVAEACEMLQDSGVGWFGYIQQLAKWATTRHLATELSLPGVMLEIAKREAATTREATGRNDGPVSKYFRGAVRRNAAGIEQLTDHTDGWDWCAAAVTWCASNAAGQLGIVNPVRQRIAVWEIVRDARELGRWCTASATPAPGWYAVYGRNGQDPRNPGEQGHVAIVDTVEADGYRDLNPNAGVAWGYRDRSFGEAVGYVRTS